MIVLKDVTGAATALAEDLGARLEQLGVYRFERRPWLSHVTVLRFRERAGLTPEVANIRSIMSSGRPSTVPNSAAALQKPAGRRTTHSKRQALGGVDDGS